MEQKDDLFAVQIFSNLVLISYLFSKLHIGHKAVMIRSSIWTFCYPYKSNQDWKLQHMVELESGPNFVFGPWCLVCSAWSAVLVFGLHDIHDDDLGVWFLKLESTNAWVVADSFLLGHLKSVKYIFMECNWKISLFKPTIYWFFLMAASLIFYKKIGLFASLKGL